MSGQEAAETEDDYQENEKKKKEDQKARNDQADPVAVTLLSDVPKLNSFSRRRDADDDSQENVGNKEENQKPRNPVEDFETPLEKTSSQLSTTSAPLSITNSGTTLKNQNPPRQEPEDSYTRRLLSDVETQIGFFKGAIFYKEKNKKYPFLDSKSMKEFIADWLQVGVSDTDLMKVVKQLKFQYEKRLVEIKGKLDCLDSDKDRAFDWAHKIWGNPKKPTISSVYEEDERSTKRLKDDHYGDDDQGAMKKMKKNPESTFTFNTQISILNRILDYQRVVGRYPFADHADMINLSTNWVPLKVPVETLIHWACKWMFQYKEIKQRAVNSFNSAEEQEFYELAHQIWGSI
ncbi:hypothetical protein HS088_TW21G00508 [Tripterygium wilfordii]|uniref:Glabrous enhancer-binding protein-like DBD domain-containing protein n=1 Tax=Tripterygium wilfordii TaxID=458696 RepID=A0A7J7C2N4_TRIWF|nr:hypothetical protein HS088_TW21G00508 [Tripterygium wilfordii]